MSAVLQQIAAESERKSAANERRYAELLLSGNENAATVSELRDLASKLGKSPDELIADSHAVQRYQTYREGIDAGSGLDEQRQQSELVVRESFERMEAEIKKLREAHVQLVHESNRLEERYLSADRAVHQLEALTKKHPHLFSSVRVHEISI